ncbi:MAG TPA: TolC family protein [Phnomibacter sp.]|nr:TolC family protein [Phnomibacter sp.]
MNRYTILAVACISCCYTACKIPEAVSKTENKNVPSAFGGASADTNNLAQISWKQYFTDPDLQNLIDTALKNNQELNITLQEIAISGNEIKARKGELLPFVSVGAGAGVEKVGRYTSQGAGDATTEIKPGKEMPDPLPDMLLSARATWEIDIWHKLRNAKEAAIKRYLSTIEGRNFLITTLIAEIANSYYELLALDNQLAIVQQNIQLQSNALEIVKIQKEASKVTELAVRKFEAEVLNTKSMQYELLQQIAVTENRINFLLGRFPQHIARNAGTFDAALPSVVHVGIPSQLLANRPDIKQAELDLAAAKLDVKVAKAQFYPSLSISAGIGYNAFSPALLFKTPESMLYSLAGELAAPLINKAAIKSAYANANYKQIQAVYNYERSILNGYVEVANQLSNIGNLEKNYEMKSKQVLALTQSIDISNDLFKSARADYLEVLMTQRDALESKLELVETKKQQMNAMVNIYQALGGGWN